MNEQRKIETEEVAAPAKPPKAPPLSSLSRSDGEGDHAQHGGGAIPPRNGEGDHLPQANGGGAGTTSETPSETLARKRDYLEGFLSKPPRSETPAPVEPGGDLYEQVIDALKDIYDPEIPVNIYDLGLIYDVDISPEHHVKIQMTLTTPHCPVAESMPGEVELRVGAVPGVGDCEVELVWNPPWDPQKMSDEAKLELGML
jgi:FeS assembly SUF system protein